MIWNSWTDYIDKLWSIRVNVEAAATQHAIFRCKLIRTYEEHALVYQNSTVVYHKSRNITSISDFENKKWDNEDEMK